VAPKIPADSPSEVYAAYRSASARRPGRPPGSWRGLQGHWRPRHCDQSHSAVLPAIVQVVDRWPSPHARLGLVLLRLKWHGPARGFLSGCARGRVTISLALVTFASPSEMHSGSRGPFPALSTGASLRGPKAALRVSRRSGQDRDSSLGVVKFAPPSTCLSSVHSWSCPGSEEPPARSFPRGVRFSQETCTSFGPKMPPFELVPPLPFFPASAVFSAGEIAGLLHPAANHGVRHVSGPWFSRLSAPFTRRGAVRPVACSSGEVQVSVASFHRPFAPPKRRVRVGGPWRLAHASTGSIPGGAPPFEAFPSSIAVPRHRGRCPLAIEPASFHHSALLP